MLHNRGANPGGATKILGLLHWHIDRFEGSVSSEDIRGAMEKNAQLIFVLQQDGLLELQSLGKVFPVQH